MSVLLESVSASLQSIAAEPMKHVGNAGSMVTTAAVGPTGIEMATAVVGFAVSGLIAYSKYKDIKKTNEELVLIKIQIRNEGLRDEDKS